MSVDYFRFGKGTQDLVFVQGLSLWDIDAVSAAGMKLAYRRYGKRFRVHVFDRPAQLPADCSIEFLADDLAARMAQKGITNAYLVGVSQGGMIAQYLALKHPDLVRKLLLVVTCAQPDDVLRGVVANWLELAAKGDQRGLVMDFMPRVYSKAYIKRNGWMLPFLARKKTMPMERFSTLTRALLTLDTLEQLPGIACPVYALGGACDGIVSIEAFQRMVGALGCDSYVYPDLAHGIYDEARDFHDRVLAFLG
ncbi:MAG: alpha/beta hydrolase [Coriobacteriales bacterium]|nr:alpha/beta hydrolase [Coriobacteriales bacterium]